MITAQFEIVREVYIRDDFCIYGAIPIGENANLIQLNKYRNCTLKTYGTKFKTHNIYTLTVEPTTSKYGVTYEVKSTNLDFDNVESITPELNLMLLKEITTESLAKSINDAYPNFIQLVLTDREDEIDTDNIFGVGKVLKSKYINKIKDKCTSYLLRGALPHCLINEAESKILLGLYDDIESIVHAFNIAPYTLLVEKLNRSFWSVDANKTWVQDLTTPLNDFNRIEHMILAFLSNDEIYGNTYMSAVKLGEEIVNYDSSVVDRVVNVANDSNKIVYDVDKGIIQSRKNYEVEKRVARFIRDRLNNSDELDWDWDKYAKIKDGELTDEQRSALEIFCKSNFMVLQGHAGCVDCDTEYFNGTEWKKISEYTKGEKVLQYNEGGSANLVEPWAYIKEPCDTMYHFETKYGLNQTLTADHTVVYQGNGGGLHTKPMYEIMDMHDNNLHGFSGKFYTTFHYNGNGIGMTDEAIRVMCAVICDGSFDSKSTKAQSGYMRCSFNIKKERKKERLRKLFCDANILWKEKDSTSGYTKFYIHAPRREKTFGSFWYNCSNHQLQVICDEIMYWDGNTYKTENGATIQRYSTTVKANADFIQFAFSACGKRANLLTHDRRGRIKIVKDKSYIYKSIEYEVSISSRNNISIYNSHKKVPITKVVPSDGYKYCFTVPSHMLVLRRKDKIFITGNCGKTSSVMALLQMIEDNGLDYLCVSPTGRAAKRLSEQTGRKAYTIHKVCMGDEAQIVQDVVIVDEVSMLSMDVCDMLFSTISNPNVRIVFVGDSGQLPPIGLGRVFRDIINSNIVPITTLTKVFRFDYGGMAMISEQTRRGELPMFPNATTQYGDDFTFIPFESVEQVVDIYLNELKTTPIEDIMLLTPQNKGEYGTLNLNNIIQSRINKIDEEFDDYVTTTINGVKVRFKRGDIVINCKNNYGMKVSMGDETNVMNGQIGKVVKVGVDVDGDKIMVIDFDGEDVIFTEDTFNSLKLGNAITTHKSQGSEAKVVINLTIPQHKHMLSKELTYTSRTRAKCKLIEIGSPEIIDWAQSVNANDVAQTRLCEFLLDTNG